MITAVPVMDERLSNHFTKAHHFIFVNDNGEFVSSAPNPALADGCSGKANLIDMLKANSAGRVLVKNIGSRMLSRLFDNEIQVIMAERGRAGDLRRMLQGDNVTQLLDLSRARISKKYEDKKASGESCCHSHSGMLDSSCHTSGHSSGQRLGHSCCHSGNHGNQGQNGHKRCCQRK